LFPAHMSLSQSEAKTKIDGLIANARRFGGVLTINWHDRIMPAERCWHRLYTETIAEVKKNGAWFATGSEAVAWFRKRRAATFDSALSDRLNEPKEMSDGVTDLVLKSYSARNSESSLGRMSEVEREASHTPRTSRQEEILA